MTAMKKTENGFTLIELMVAIAMASIVIIVIFSAYNVQTKIYTEQDKAAEMQQNIRAGMFYLQREARMAGYNPQNAKNASCNTKDSLAAGFGVPMAPGIHTATATTFGFSMDFRGAVGTSVDGDGDCDDPGENVTYSIYTADGMRKLGRKAPTANEPVAENITDIDFAYIYSPPTSTQFKDIVAAQVSLLARASTPDRKSARTTSFYVPVPDASGAPKTAGGKLLVTYPDNNFSWRLLTATINCRNAGLK